MTQDEQKQFDHLQAQLSEANRNIGEIRTFLSAALGKSNNEAQMYRSLFWILFLLTMVVTILHFFQK